MGLHKFISNKLLVILTCAAILFIIGAFSLKTYLRTYLHKHVELELKKISDQIHQPIVFQNLDFNIYSVTLTDFAVGQGPFFSVSKLTINVELFPWSKNFKKILSLQGDYFYLKLSSEELAAINALNSNISQKMTRLYPSQSHKLKSVNFFKNEAMRKYFAADADLNLTNGKFIWQRKDKEPMAIETVDIGLKLDSENNPAIELVHRSINKSHENRSFKIQINIKNETFLIKFIGNLIPEPFINNIPWVRGIPHIDGQLTLNNIDTAAFKFKMEMQVDGLSLDNPRLSYEPVGPIDFHVDSFGVVDLTDQQLQIENFEIAFNSEGVSPVAFQMSSIFNMRKSMLDQKTGPSNITLALTMPSTDCSSIIQSFPESILGDVKKFKLDGKVDFGMSFQFDLKNPEETTYRFDQFNFNCNIIAAPQNFSKDYLNGPFVLERASDGEKIKDIHVDPKDSSFASFDAISKVLVDTIIASEDTGFWAHHGVEAGALEQAVKRNLTEGRLAVGGSTITMQTTRNLFLSRDKNLTRKLQEIFLSWYLEKILSKKRILEIYLNIIEFGPNIFGIQNASQHYFNKNAAGLLLKQSVFLAQLLPAPVSRYRNFCMAKPTENFVFLMDNLFARMLKLGRISSETYAMARAMPLKFAFENRIASACSSSQ